MDIFHAVKGVVDGFLHAAQADWWLEITTSLPSCTYYFGPFDHLAEAEAEYPGYLKDLTDEGATGIEYRIKRCTPTVMTICQEGD